MIRKIAIITGSRAEYGLLRPLIREIKADKNAKLILIATGQHLSPTYNKTVNEILADGFEVDWQVESLIDSDSMCATTKSVGLGVVGFSDALSQLKPEIVVVLGDRFEIMAASLAAFFLKIPLVHIHGGEVTLGSIDESIRHAITKLACLHFVSTEVYRNRVIQMGEQPSRVFNVGAIGLENIKQLELYTKEEFSNHYHYYFSQYNFLVVYHPATRVNEDPGLVLSNIVSVLKEYPNANILINGTNSDEGGRKLMKCLQEIGAVNQYVFVNSFGSLGFLSAVKLFDVLIGNSSSGIFEAPSLGTPTVNIGQRQRGRIQAPSVIDCGIHETEIKSAVNKALTDDFKAKAQEKVTPYASKGYNIASQIKKVLLEVELNSLLFKQFYDLPAVCKEDLVNAR